MLIETRDFGQVEIGEQDGIHFCQPIFGFENLREYVVLFDDEISESFVWLQSLEDPDVCFMMVDPAVVDAEYRPVLPDGAAKELGGEEAVCWCILTVPGSFEQATVNLKSPVMIHPQNRKGLQVILDGEYSVRHPLMKNREGAGSC